jgi:hypothetical protein
MMEWRCEKGHTWQAVVSSRTPPVNNGCPFCAGKKAIPGINDLATLFPKLAEEAYGWDPSTVQPGSNKKLQWRCPKEHIWSAVVTNRTPPQSSGCPVCTGRQVLAGFNDLTTLYPELAKEAYGWEASTVTAGSSKKLQWRCAKGHTWHATVANRVGRSSDCPDCAEFGFKERRDKEEREEFEDGDSQLENTSH